MKAGWHALCIYVVLILAGVAAIVAADRGAELSFIATRDLAANHLLLTGDLALEANGRQYLPQPVRRDQRVLPRDLSTTPQGSGRAETEPASFSIASEMVRTAKVATGDSLHLCEAQLKLQVRALFCGDGTGDCLAVVDLTAAEREAVEKAGAQAAKLQQECKE